jgi:trimeric autotransporter adhesin
MGVAQPAAAGVGAHCNGVPNLVGYAPGFDPNTNSASLLPVGSIAGGDFVLTITQPAGVSGVSYGAEWSTTLEAGSWTAIHDTGAAPEHSFRLAIATHPRLSCGCG